MNAIPRIIWNPSESFKKQTHLRSYQRWLGQNEDLDFKDYDSLWQWSVDNVGVFWKSIYDYFQVIDHGIPEYIVSGGTMPHVSWFGGSKVNYAEHILRHSQQGSAIIFQREGEEVQEMTWEDLRLHTARFAHYLMSKGVRKGDCVVAYLPNIPQATVAFLAAASIGAVWSSCSPDFGVSSVMDRFGQIKPKVLIAADGYRYGGKYFDRRQEVGQLMAGLPTLEHAVGIDYVESFATPGMDSWDDIVREGADKLTFEPLDFSHPIWVLYSSGTTGQPKAITHSVGGALLEHLKYVHFHNDVKPGERYFWYTTTGWMMWNFVQSTLLAGATIVLYDGSPAFPDMGSLWSLAERVGVNHFGTSAPYILASMKSETHPCTYELSMLRSLSSTGSPLPAEAFKWISWQLPKVWPISMSGGTDVCSAFVGGCPTEPVYMGEIQRRALGCAMYAYDAKGQPQVGEVGEMVVAKPMPSMPVYFWNDEGGQRYESSYFDVYPGVWRHGDWLMITERHTLIIKGRSDATLNRHGVRIGTAEIYQVLSKIPEIADSLIVNLEVEDGGHFMPLFLVLSEEEMLTDDLQNRIHRLLKREYSPRHVPDEIVVVSAIPYTISGKKMEAPVKRILQGVEVHLAANIDTMRNPESLDAFVRYKQNRVK